MLRLLSHDAFILNVRTRFPFRYGIASLTACPHLFLRGTFEIDGRSYTGLAADNLPPKWFTKDPDQTYHDELSDMFRVIRHACDAAMALPPASTLYTWWQALYQTQSTWASTKNTPPLLANFGVSLVERAAIQAFCIARSTPFPRALHQNLFGITDIALDQLPPQPLRHLIARHTVGLTDPLTESEISAADRVDDGLPQSLDQCIDAYGLTHFKIKLSGDVARDASRLRDLSHILAEKSPHYAFTLDGNENFHAIEPLRELWASLTADTKLASFLSRLIFLEQPLHRDIALSDDVQSALRAWPNHPPIIIDESDATLDSHPRALACGYNGTSHKNCKGIFKGIINASRIASLRRLHPDSTFLLSGEDLSNLPPVALTQDLAVMATLGITHVERNGHHYFKGLSHLPTDVQQTALAHHRDLYHMHPQGFPAVHIEDGKIAVGTCADAPFGIAFDLDPSYFTPFENWKFESM